jgi:nitrite reductase/ring-hydroxylating ferredoxin subunit
MQRSTSVLDDDWHPVCRVDELGEEEVIAHVVGETAIAVYRLNDGYYATSDICAHQGASLSEGFIEGQAIECPLHQGRYDIPTGEPISGPACEQLPLYPVSTQDGWIYVQYAEEME